MEIIEVSYRKKGSVRRKIARTAKKTKKKSKSLSKYKKKLDAVFSKFIRAKYQKTCYTCGASGKTLQCGHFVSRMYLATRWEEDNCRPQCVGCNIWGSGKPLDFEENLTKELGAKRVQELKDARKQFLKLNEAFYLDKIAHYQQLLSLLETKDKT